MFWSGWRVTPSAVRRLSSAILVFYITTSLLLCHHHLKAVAKAEELVARSLPPLAEVRVWFSHHASQAGKDTLDLVGKERLLCRLQLPLGCPPAGSLGFQCVTIGRMREVLHVVWALCRMEIGHRLSVLLRLTQTVEMLRGLGKGLLLKWVMLACMV